MSQHYTEADLLETYYTQPGESMPVMMHLADCAECAARYERLDRKIRSLADCEHDKPETFWARQRIGVMRKIDAQRSRNSFAARTTRIAAAAALVVALSGGVMTWKNRVPDTPVTDTTITATTAEITTDTSVPTDPWQSDELKEFQSVVNWESWVESSNGDKSL